MLQLKIMIIFVFLAKDKNNGYVTYDELDKVKSITIVMKEMGLEPII